MEKFKIIIMLCFLLPVYLTAQESGNDIIIPQNYVPRAEYDAFDQSGMGILRNQEVAIVYVDFPDGRYIENGILEQPTTISHLLMVQNIDAVGEVGLTNEPNEYFQVGPYYINPCKYSYSDRWNMFFSANYFTGDKHPDYSTHGTNNGVAFGSFKDYWSEVSNYKYNIIPALTHPGETDPIYRTGIVNRYMQVGTKKIIEYITLPKNKYGPDSNSAYFPNRNIFYYGSDPSNIERISLMKAEAIAQVILYKSQGRIDFDIESFINNGGTVIFVTAGSHQSFKGIASLPSGQGNIKGTCIVRGMFNHVDSVNSTIDGITCLSHEFAHSALGWNHTIAGRNCLMNLNQTKDINCPTHPSPIFKLREGWVSAIHKSQIQNDIELDPVESNYQVGVVTIYGNPSAGPDHLSGECFVIENRKRIGFDRKIHFDDENYSAFKGGVLIWQYSPYGDFGLPGNNLENIKLITPIDTLTPLQIYTSGGEPHLFFANVFGSSYQYFYNLFSNRTYSHNNLKTGIEFTNIQQLDYNNINSKIRFNLNYTISEPPQYEYTILSNTQGGVINTSGDIYFHKPSVNDIYFYLNPGAKLDVAKDQKLIFKGIKANGNPQNKVTIRGAGYENETESYFCKFNGMETSLTLTTYQEVDSVVFRNVDFKNLNNNYASINIKYISTYTNKVPTIIENITADRLQQSNYDIILAHIPVAKMSVSDLKFDIIGIYCIGDINLINSDVQFKLNTRFSDTANLVLNNSNVRTLQNAIFDTPNSHWNGMILYGGSIDVFGTKFSNATVGLRLNNLNGKISIKSSEFRNLAQDIWVNNFNQLYEVDKIISDNQFYSHPLVQTGSITITNSNQISVNNNTFHNILSNGIYIGNSIFPELKENIITGLSGSDVSIGIISYQSGGYYECNDISECIYGIMLDNSQPILFNNYIHINGIGMYVSNNSYPIMAPAYLPDKTVNMAGYNTFYCNSGNEIYIKNTNYSLSNLLMDQGYNVLEDVDQIALIYMDNTDLINPPEIVKCSENCWNQGIDPANYLFPVQYFEYVPYLIQVPAPPSFCQITTINENNSSESTQTLLLGNMMNEAFIKNYNQAKEYSQQLSQSSGLNHYKKTGYTGLFQNTVLSKGNLNELPIILTNYMLNNQSDSLLFRHIRNLKMESEVLDSAYLFVLNQLDQIISSSSNILEVHYSIIKKLRVLNLLDSVVHGFGDNPITINTYQEIDKIIRNNWNDKKESHIVSSVLTKMQERINDELNSGTQISKNELIRLSQNKLFVELVKSNYIPNIPSYTYKLIYKKNKENENIYPKKYELFQNYPNPFNPVTNIQFDIPKEELVTLKVYDILGREVRNIVSEFKQAGSYIVSFDGSELASGIYFYRLESGNFVQVKRMIILK